MKNVFFCLFMLTCSIVSAQVTKLSSLSTSKFLDSKIIYDDKNTEDVFGYLLLYEKDKISKYETTLELVLIDKNLNKVGSTNFTQEGVSYWLVKLGWSIYFAKKSDSNIYISIGQSVPALENSVSQMFEDQGVSSFRVLNFKSFSLSDNYFIKGFEFKKQTEKLDVEHPMKLMKEMKNMNFTKITANNGFIVSDVDYMEAMMEVYMGQPSRKAKKQKAFYFYDFDFKQKWIYNLNQDEKSKSFYKYTYYTGDGNDMIFVKKFYEKPKDNISDISFDILDAGTGRKKYEISLASAQNIFITEDFQFEKNKIIIFASVYDFDKKGNYQFDEKRGYVKFIYDRSTGKELSKDFFYWKDFAGKLDINDEGKIKDYGFIEFLDFKPTTDGKFIVIAEGYKPENNTKILDLFTFVFDEKMKLLSYKQVDKFKNKIDKVYAFGSSLDYMGAFDYMYSQKLPGGGYVFYYSDNEKTGLWSNKNPKWILGAITYVDGVFDYQKVPLTNKNGQIYPIRAKNGYVLLKEVPKDNEKDSELRLEKINY